MSRPGGSRITKRFEERLAAGKKVLIPYITAGDPTPDTTVPLMHSMVKAGADIIELGVPFSDPMAEGPVIQKAMERALEYGTSLSNVLEMVAEFRQTDNDTPVVVMGYLNPIEVMGYSEFADKAAKAGVDGVLTVDIPPEEADEYITIFKNKGLDPIFLVAPTTNAQRMELICKAGAGFVYYVSVKGVTGAGHLNTDEVSDKVEQIKSFTNLPVGVGFGIKDADSARRVAKVADAVVVGSAIVHRIEENSSDSGKINTSVCELIKELRAGIDTV